MRSLIICFCFLLISCKHIDTKAFIIEKVTVARTGDESKIAIVRNKLIFTVSSESTSLDSNSLLVLFPKNCHPFQHDLNWCSSADSLVAYYSSGYQTKQKNVANYELEGYLMGNSLNEILKHYSCLWGKNDQIFLAVNNKRFSTLVQKSMPIEFKWNGKAINPGDSLINYQFVPWAEILKDSEID